jgi:hypothetical protein
MPDPQVPTEDQVKAANEAEAKKWEGDFSEESLSIPYKREEIKTNDKQTDDKSTDTEDVTEDTDTEVTYSEPEPVVTVQDPGQYTPADYSFEVTLANGKSVKVSTPEEADKLAEDPENFETPKQLLDFIRRSQKMENSLDRDKTKYEADKKAFDEQKASETQRLEALNVMQSEFDYLVSKGSLPKIDKQYLDADWSDPEVAKQSGVKEQIDLINYMQKENAVRAKAKVKPITSVVDAYNAWKLENKSEIDAKEQARVAAGEARKAAGARVAGSSPAQQGSYVPKGIAVGNPNVLKRGAAVWDD